MEISLALWTSAKQTAGGPDKLGGSSLPGKENIEENRCGHDSQGRVVEISLVCGCVKSRRLEGLTSWVGHHYQERKIFNWL